MGAERVNNAMMQIILGGWMEIVGYLAGGCDRPAIVQAASARLVQAQPRLPAPAYLPYYVRVYLFFFVN